MHIVVNQVSSILWAKLKTKKATDIVNAKVNKVFVNLKYSALDVIPWTKRLPRDNPTLTRWQGGPVVLTYIKITILQRSTLADRNPILEETLS